MSRNADSDENGDSGEISSINLTTLMQITSTEMDLTCWRIWRFLYLACSIKSVFLEWNIKQCIISIVLKSFHPSAMENNINFLCSLSVMPKRNLSSTMRVARGGNGKQSRYWYFPLPLYFFRSVSVLPNGIPRCKACYPCVTESQIYLPTSKACFSSGTKSNVSWFRSFWNRLTRGRNGKQYIFPSFFKRVQMTRLERKKLSI